MIAASTANPANPANTATAPAPSPDHALDALRAARLRRDLAAEGSSIWLHAPRPAIVPAAPQYANQHRFCSDGTDRTHSLHPSNSEARALHADVQVFRNGEGNLGELSIKLGRYTSAEIAVLLSPAELRELAARLVDAAHDIEAHPAEALAAQVEGGAA